MKQGKASVSGMGATKREPISNLYDPRKVADIGVKQVHVTSMSPTRGASSPSPKGMKVHNCGSQGKH